VRTLPFARRPKPDEAQVALKVAALDGGTPSPGDQRTPEEMGLLELLAEDLTTHDKELLEPGLWAVATHRLGRRVQTLPSGPSRAALEGAHHVMFTTVDWLWGIHLPTSVHVGRRVRLWHNGCMLLTARSIGNDVHIRHDTTFGPVRGRHDHALPVIGDRADIGSGACVLGAVTVGQDATVGANSVVMKDVPASAMVLGVPARIVPK
jgi:serine O-acetyltransferase